MNDLSALRASVSMTRSDTTARIKCPACDSWNSKVYDSRGSNNSIRRRRGCLDCGNRFTTYETPEGILPTGIQGELKTAIKVLENAKMKLESVLERFSEGSE
jgi:transcriptional regulator NrdR family protein